MHYFDHSATTPINLEVLELINKVQKINYANPSSLHSAGKKAKTIIEESRKRVAKAINAEPDQIFFTSGGTESNNHVLWSMLSHHNAHVITDVIEHPAILKVLEYLKTFGLNYSLIKVNSKGRIDLKELEEKITKKTCLISVMLANNEIGTIQPIREIIDLMIRKDILMHTDAVQCLGKMKVDVKELRVDFLSLSSHKFYGPKGVGILYVKNRDTIKSLILGGSQEGGLRGGTENVASIAGAGLAAELSVKYLKENSKKLDMLKLFFINELKLIFPNIIINGDSSNSLPGLASISFPGFRSDILLAKLDRVNIAVSNGAACGSGNVKPSSILSAIGMDDKTNLSTLRFSFGTTNTIVEIKKLLEALKLILNNK